MRYRMLISILFVVLCSLLGSSTSSAQLVTNSGAMIHVKEGASMVIDGDVVSSDGDIRLYDTATLRCTGAMRVLLGGLYMERLSEVVIERNLVIDRFGICWRYAPGVLHVYGVIRNDGELNNEGEIIIGRP